MKQEFIPYEQALEIKELGFDEPCFGFYDESLYFPNNENQYGTFCNQKLDVPSCSAPLYQQAFRWFREKYKIVHEIQFGSGKIWIRYGYNSFVRALELDNNNDEFYHTYEEAELACLKKLIEIVKEETK